MPHCSGDRLWGEEWVGNRNLVQLHRVSIGSRFINSSGQPCASYFDTFARLRALWVLYLETFLSWLPPSPCLPGKSSTRVKKVPVWINQEPATASAELCPGHGLDDTEEPVKQRGCWVLSCSQGWFPNEGEDGSGVSPLSSGVEKQAGKSGRNSVCEG